MKIKKKGWKVLTLIPRKVKKEVKKNRRSTPFLVSISFLFSFLIARIWVITLGADQPSAQATSVGKNLILGGYHIHHITYGIIFVSVAAWLSINYWSRSIVRISSILYGIGLGFIVDELGFIIGGIEPYQADQEVFYIAVFIFGALLRVVYFPSFYRSIKREIRRWQRIIFNF